MQGTDALEKGKQKIGKKLLNNLALKLGSVILAVVIWFAVVMLSNPKDSVTFSGISVNLIHTELFGEDKIYEVLDSTDKIRVTVEAPRKVINQLRASDIIAEADVSRLTEVNTVAINCTVLNGAVGISSITSSPESVRLKVEEKIKKWVNVKRSTVGEVAEGYVITGTVSDQTRMEISGPKSVVERIDHVGLEMDVTGATETVSGNVEIRFFDGNGKLVDGSEIIKNSNTMQMEARVLARKEVPVEVDLSGELADGYLTSGPVVCEPTAVVLAGTAAVLADISKISVPLDITGAKESVSLVVSIRGYLPGNVSLADSDFNGRVNVSVPIEASVERVLSVPESNVSIRNLPEGFRVEQPEVPQAYRVRVSGLASVIYQMEAASVQGTVDIAAWMLEQNRTELAAGSYEIPVAFEVPEGVTLESEVSANVTIVESDGEVE